MESDVAQKPTEQNTRNNPGDTPRRVPVAELLAGSREIILDHDGQHYRLRLTSNGKLILTK